MKFVQILFLLSIAISSVNAGKITWNTEGKPIIAGIKKPAEGCSQGGFNTPVEDLNVSSSCS